MAFQKKTINKFSVFSFFIFTHEKQTFTSIHYIVGYFLQFNITTRSLKEHFDDRTKAGLRWEMKVSEINGLMSVKIM